MTCFYSRRHLFLVDFSIWYCSGVYFVSFARTSIQSSNVVRLEVWKNQQKIFFSFSKLFIIGGRMAAHAVSLASNDACQCKLRTESKRDKNDGATRKLAIQFATDHRETNLINFSSFRSVSGSPTTLLTWNHILNRCCEWAMMNVRWHIRARHWQGTQHEARGTLMERKRNSTNGNKRTSALPSYSSGVVFDIFVLFYRLPLSLSLSLDRTNRIGESVTFLIIQMVFFCCYF